MSAILEGSPHPKYYLTPTACRGILRRAARRGKELPPVLHFALKVQATIPPEILAQWKASADNSRLPPIAFSCNQRDEVRELHDVAGAVQAQPGMKQQTFVAAIPIEVRATSAEVAGDSASLHRGAPCGGTSSPAGPLQPPAGLKGNENCLTPWDTQQARITTEHGVAPTVAGADGGGGRNPAGLVFAAFCAGAGAKAKGIGYEMECSPTLKGGEGGNMMPSVICLNDQGGQRMDVYEDMVGTLRSQMDGHPPLVLGSQQGDAELCVDLCPAITAAAGTSDNNQPLVFENHGMDSRYKGPLDVAPTLGERTGTGCNNLPLAINCASYAFSIDSSESNSMKSSNPNSGCKEVDIARTIDTTIPCPSKNQGGIAVVEETYAIAGNIVDRQPHNGGNGIGYQRNISYTITSNDRHCVYAPIPYQTVIGALCKGDEKGTGSQYVSQDKCIIQPAQAARQYKNSTSYPNQSFGTGTGNLEISGYKDATDLVCEVAGLDCFGGKENGDLCGTIQAGTSLNKVHPVRIGSLVRRLTPLECERLMGFPDHWTNIPGASDSRQYRACGNSVAIPCVEYIMMGIAAVFEREGA